MTSLAAFIATTLFAATFTAAATSSTFATVASSAVLILAAFSPTVAPVKTSLAVEVDPLPPNPLGTVDAATLKSGCGAVAAPGTCCPDSGVH
jgi:hypothetical protein